MLLLEDYIQIYALFVRCRQLTHDLIQLRKQPTKTKMTNDIINITAYPQSGLIETYSKVGHYTPADMSYTPDAENIKTHNYDFYCTVTEPLSDLADFLLYSEIEFNGKIYYIQSITVTNTEVKMFGALQGVSDEI